MSTRNSNGKALNQKVQVHKDGTKEYWRDISGYEGRYRVSDRGRVKSLQRMVQSKKRTSMGIRARFLKPIRNPTTGRTIVLLCKNSRYQAFYIYHLVLIAFVGSCPPGMECRHFPDRSVSNNNLKNLCWGTKAENGLDKIFHGTTLRGSAHPRAILNEHKVRKIRRLAKTGRWTKQALADRFKVSRATIRKIVNYEMWTYI